MLVPYTSKYIRVAAGSQIAFRCTRCGKCCTTGPNVALTVFDVLRIARFLRVEPLELVPNAVNVVIADLMPFLYLTGSAGECTFFRRKLNGEGLCVIYPARPMRCRLYPVLVEALSHEALYLDPKCPGLKEGSPRNLPWDLIKLYLEERREHYELLYELMIKRGLEPHVALKRAFELASATKLDSMDLDYLASYDFS